MEQIKPSVDVATSIQRPGSTVGWGAIAAGVFGAVTATIMLLMVGSGLGMTMVSPWSYQNASITAATVAVAIWMIVVQWISAGFGGYLAGRLRAADRTVRSDENAFRDSVHGFLAWAAATLLMFLILGQTLAGAVSGSVQYASNVSSALARNAAAGSTSTGPDDGDMSAYFVDRLFRADLARTAEGGVGAATTAEATRILIASAATGQLSEDDRNYLAQMVAARTGVSPSDAQARVNDVMARIETAKAQAQDAAEKARKAGIAFSLLGALSLAVGAFVASAAAALGGKLRDDQQKIALA